MWLTGSVCTSQQNGKILNSYNRFFARILYLRKICTPPGFFNLHETYMRNILILRFQISSKKSRSRFHFLVQIIAQKMKFSIKNFFSVCDQVRRDLTSFSRLYCELWTDFTQCFDVSVVDFEQVNAGLVYLCLWIWKPPKQWFFQVLLHVRLLVKPLSFKLSLWNWIFNSKSWNDSIQCRNIFQRYL